MTDETTENHSDKYRVGHAGVHDLVDIENFNRTLKKNEIVTDIESIYLPVPDNYKKNTFKFVLVQGPHDEREGSAVLPLGLGYIARILDNIGVDVRVVDAAADRMNFDETLKAILSSEADFIGITALSTQYKFVKWISGEIKKKRNIPIILGAQLAHYNSKTVLENTGVDICVIGEGEITVQDIIYNYNDLSKVKGIAFIDSEDKYIKTETRPRIKNPDIIPFPYWEKFNLNHYYFQNFYGSKGTKGLNILTSRGCPYSCTFCSLSFPNVTYRSVDNVIEEIKLLKEKFGIDAVGFIDELFVISKKRVYEFCDKLKGLDISWGGQGRANIIDDDEKLLRAMKDSGAAYIGYGLESATSEMLSSMQKKTSVQQNINCVKAAQKVGLKVIAQFMFGFPGETFESVKASVDYFNEIHYVPPLGLDALPHISLTLPIPGSQLYEDAKAKGIVGDEDEYLSKISRGYFYNEEVIVNLTSFTDAELIDLKYAAQNAMVENLINYNKSVDRFFRVKMNINKIKNLFKYHGVFNAIFILLRTLYRILLRKRKLSNLLLEKADYIFKTKKGSEFRKFLKGSI